MAEGPTLSCWLYSKNSIVHLTKLLTYRECVQLSLILISTRGIANLFEHLPRYHWHMASIVSQIVVILVNRVQSDMPVYWPTVKRRNLP